MSKQVEKWFPLVGALGAAVAYYLLLGSRGTPSDFDPVLSAAITVGAIAIGFLATVKAILVSIVNRRIVRYLRESGKWPNLVGYLMRAIYWSGATVLLSVVLLLIDYPARCAGSPVGRLNTILCGWKTGILTAWVAVCVGMVLGTYRITSIFARILISDQG